MPIFNTKRENIKKTLKETTFPKDVIVETSAYCNLKCIMCPQSTMERPKGYMDFKVFTKIASEVADKSPKSKLWLAIMGEPLLDKPSLISMVQFAKSAGVGSVHLNTNGMLLDEDTSTKLLEAKLDEILIGIDASKINTYESIRVGGSLVKVEYNVLRLLRLIQLFPKDFNTKVIVQFIVMEQNEAEVKEFKRTWTQLGAIVKIRPRLGWRVKDTYNLDVGNQERYPCPWLINAASIQWNGKFNQCDGGWSGEYSPGDINTQTIEEVWNGELKERRARHWAGDFTHPLCKECKDWMVPKSKFYYPRRQK